ncbi:SAPC2 protein, partial [Sterrhoptilus dennistouni]|nr:SAPC2 protein [Sterrhoptilus dennistouni]
SAAMAPERGDRSVPAGTEGLPRLFLQSLRTLFDILDDRRRGYVHLREIESRWRGAEAQEVPAGVMEGLRRAAPASGFLTFERFVLGLRAALPGAQLPLEVCPDLPGGCPGKRHFPSCLPSLPSSLLLFLKSRVGKGTLEETCVQGAGELQNWEGGTAQGALGTWHLGTGAGREGQELLPRLAWGCAGCTPGCPGAVVWDRGVGHPGAGDTRRHQRGRAERRRHTITNGVDFSMLKYMKELEQEKDFLLQGLELIDRAREWYHQRIQLMQEHQRLLGNKRTSADFPEGGQSHLGCLIPKLQEVNCCLNDLLSIAGKTANPSSALSRLVPVTSPASTGSQQVINMLKEQNRLLTKEVTDKSEHITQLEQEKSALIKQLFEARAHNNHEMSQLDSTFI